MTNRMPLKSALAVLVAAVLFIVAAIPAAALTVTFVRHGESEANASHTIDNSIPGAHLTELGQAQSQTVADALVADGTSYDAIYASNMLRTTETAAPFAAATGMTPIVAPGFREINAGVFEGWSDAGLGGIGYVLAPALWTVGLRSLPIPGGGDGNAFDARVDAALQLVEESGAQNPVVFSHAATIMFWTMMNVDNPDLGLMLLHRLDNTDVVVVDGNAEDGWTLKSWAGIEVGPATLPTKLLVSLRDLVVAPQTAAYDVVQAFRTGDIRTIAKALRDGIGVVARAPITFTATVIRDIGEAVTNTLHPETRVTEAPATHALTEATEATEATERTGNAPQDPAPEPVQRTPDPVEATGALRNDHGTETATVQVADAEQDADEDAEQDARQDADVDATEDEQTEDGPTAEPEATDAGDVKTADSDDSPDRDERDKNDAEAA